METLYIDENQNERPTIAPDMITLRLI